MDNISKTVRLPADLVDYINRQEGSNFSQKLVNILEEYRHGDELRRERLAFYDCLLSERREALKEVTDKLYNAGVLLHRITDALKDAVSEDQGK